MQRLTPTIHVSAQLTFELASFDRGKNRRRLRFSVARERGTRRKAEFRPFRLCYQVWLIDLAAGSLVGQVVVPEQGLEKD